MIKKDVISINELTKEDIEYIINVAHNFESDDNKHTYLQGKILANVFYETSTRTKLSFNVAMKRLGGNVIGFSHFKNSSFIKGESFYDTLKIIEGYCDIIAIRAPWEGAARYASEITNIPVINAGDGSNQHPTQTLLDLYTIRKSQSKIDGLKIALVGDLKYGRTVHSLAKALRLFDVKLYLVSPKELEMPQEYKDEMAEHGIEYSEHREYESIIDEIDIMYVTRIQKERFPDINDYNKVKNSFMVRKAQLDNVKSNFRILHPLPRVNEIHTDVDETDYAIYFEQAKNGVTIREALIYILLMGKKDASN